MLVINHFTGVETSAKSLTKTSLLQEFYAPADNEGTLFPMLPREWMQGNPVPDASA